MEEYESELNKLVKEESKVEKLTAKLKEFGVDVDQLLEDSADLKPKAHKEVEVLKSTPNLTKLQQETGRGMRLFHDYRSLRLQQISMLKDPVEKKKQETKLETRQQIMVQSVKDFMAQAKAGTKPVEYYFNVLKDEIDDLEKSIADIKDQLAKKK